ncbi:hypothetical protein SLE2022_102700 [Rubroshorea leprosula]
MGNRGQKRSEMGDELPADKRACSSLEFRPSSSNSSVHSMQVHSTNSTPETHEGDMDTSSSASASDGEPDKDSTSCDSDDTGSRRRSILRDYQRRRSSSDHGKLSGILSNLNEENEQSGLLAALTQLCEVLSFITEDSLSGSVADSLSPLLVKLTKHENNAEIILLSVRAITYLCDVFPRSSSFLVRHEAVPALCERLLAIDYVDVAEQCIQALEKISRGQPLACLQAGAIMAVLNIIDFFSTSIQRVALSTVVNICKKLPSDTALNLMEAVPILCSHLQNEDRQLVERAATCLIKIAERMSQSSDMLDELCKNGLIDKLTHLINSNSRTTLSQPIYNGLIGLLVKLSSGSCVAFKQLYELNISSILKDILSTYDPLHGMSSPHLFDGSCNQVHEVLKLLNEMLPLSVRDQGNQQMLDKESFLVSHPDLLQKLGMDILPILIQVVNSGANLFICYGCLSVVRRLVYLSKSDMLTDLLKSANISSFLAGIFTRKDHHILMLALQIAEVILQKLSDVYLNSFIKEGLLFAIVTLLSPEKCSQSMFMVNGGIHLPFDSSRKTSGREVLKCLCYAFDTGPSHLASETGHCKIEEDSVCNLAKHIKTSYFAPELFDSQKGVTDVLQNLKDLSDALSDLMNMPINGDAPAQDQEKFYSILHQIMAKICGREPVSTFEFIESGILKSLVNYLSNGLYQSDEVELNGVNGHLCVLGKRFEVFSRLLLSSTDFLTEDLPLIVMIQKLQSALSSLETFPVVLSHAFKYRNSCAIVPSRRSTTYPCFRVRFIRGEEETCLCNYSEDALTVDPFSSLDEIENFLRPKVFAKRTEHVETEDLALEQMDYQSLHLPVKANSSQGKSSGFVDADITSTVLAEMQEDEVKFSEFAYEQVVHLSQTNHDQMTTLDETDVGFALQEQQFPSASDINVEIQSSSSGGNEDVSPRLILYLEGHQLDHTLTLYQAIIQQQLRSENEMVMGANFWSKVYTITYRQAMESKESDPQKEKRSRQSSSLSDELGPSMQNTGFMSRMFRCELASGLDKSSPIYDILFLLRSFEGMNRCSFHLVSSERIHAFAEGRLDSLDNLKLLVHSVPQNEFVSSKLTEKLEQQMRDSFALSTGGLPLWCNQLMTSCPFLFGFDTRCKYFRLAAFGPRKVQPRLVPNNSLGGSSDRQLSPGSLPRKKFLASRDQILESAARMMDLHAHNKVLLEVEYKEEVGTGLGPTLEFFTLVSHEFQKPDLGMWRDDHSSFSTMKNYCVGNSGITPFGLFPRPWSPTSDACNGIEFPEVLKKFVLLGQIVAKAIQNGRILDLPFSKAFYKLIIGQDLSLYDIQSFEPELGRTLQEFQALVNRKKYVESVCGENSTFQFEVSCFRNARIEDLCLDFTLPGYPDYVLSDHDQTVNLANLEEYVKLVVDATIKSGVSRQVEAIKSGFNQVFPIEHLQIFTEEELERLLCGEQESWTFNELLDYVKFDHGYTASSPPIISILEIMKEFDHEQRRAFLQFVTGAPRLPPGGLASLHPKLTIVRKSSNCADADLPSVMTCANYLKLPPYSSKERMREKLLYAITEGQGSFHLS